MWRILVLLTGNLWVLILAILAVILLICISSWQTWVIMGIFFVIYLLTNRDSKNPNVVKARRERRMEKKAQKALRVQKAKEKQLSEMNKKQIEVVAAIIRKGDKIFVTQRGYGDWKDWWEFPGGKMEPGETPEEALKREIQEELSTEISVDKFLCTVEYDYPKFHLTMHCYWCSLISEALHLNEHEAAKWLRIEQLGSVDWLPADVLVVNAIKAEL